MSTSFFKTLVIIFGSFIAVVLSGGVAHAVSGTGFYYPEKGANNTCTATSYFTVYNCGATVPPYSNDVVPGRNSYTNSVPASATASKQGFINWLSNTGSWLTCTNSGSCMTPGKGVTKALPKGYPGYTFQDAQKLMAQNFIIDTINGTKAHDLNQAVKRINSPKVSMAVINFNPSNIGLISFYGKHSDNTPDMFFTSEFVSNTAKDLIIFYEDKDNNGVLTTTLNKQKKVTGIINDKVDFVLEVPCGNPVGGLPGLPAASDWSLYPQDTLSGGGTSGVVVSGGSVGQQASVENTGSLADTSSNYQSYEFTIPSGQSANFSSTFTDQGGGRIFALAPGGADICTWLSGKYPGVISCKSQVVGGSSKFPAGTSNIDPSAISSVGHKAGDQICRFVWVDHYDYAHKDSSEQRVSLPACVTVAKTPYVQFWGGDVRVGDSIGGATTGQANAYTASNSIGGKTYGSWAEYGIFAPTNGIIQSASAGALSGKDGLARVATDTDVNHLTFANTITPKGNWAAPAVIASYENSLGLSDGGSTAAASISLDNFPNRGKVVLTNGGTVHVGGTLPKTTPGGSLMLLYPTGTVEIDRNIILGTDSYGSLTDLSQIVIQAKNIIIDGNVSQVDAWLVAIAQNGTDGGIVSTCDKIVTPYYSGLSAKADNPCNQNQLRINGPVMGREVQLRRTFGAEGDNTPAETIDLRADAYLWTLQAANTGSIDTVFTTELPPRF